MGVVNIHIILIWRDRVAAGMNIILYIYWSLSIVDILGNVLNSFVHNSYAWDHTL